MNSELNILLSEVAEKQREAATAIDEIRERESITLSVVEEIKTKQLEIVNQIDSILREVNNEY